MKEILEELKHSMSGIVGSFVVGKDGEVIANDVPDLMNDPVNRVSKTLQHVTSVIKATRSVDRLTVDSESAKFISIPVGEKMLVVIAEKNINLPLFKLMTNMASTKLKDAPTPPKEPSFDAGKICDLYDQLYGAAAKRLANIIGQKSATHFDEGSTAVKISYPNLFNGIRFDPTGKPDIIVIRENAIKITSKDDLTRALDELLESMLDSVQRVAGPKQRQRALEEISKIKEYRQNPP
jgi:predicted regulator of Ras-like GTPase activity (Roadblock/LC7/MglB family)